MNTLIRLFLVNLLMFSALAAQQVLSVEDAIRIGLENNYNIQIARNNARIAQNNAGQGTANFLPTLNATGTVLRSTSDQETNSPFSPGGRSDTESMNGQIALSWTIFDGFRMFASNAQFRALADLGEAQARNQIETAVVNILDAYFNLVQQQQLLKVRQDALAVSEQRLEKARVRREVGGSSSTDLLNAQVSYNNDRANFLNQELRVITARNNLNLQLARDPATPVAVSEEFVLPDLQMDFEALMELAEARNSVLQAAVYNKSAADAGVGVARSGFLPRLNLNASYGYTDRTVESERQSQFLPQKQETQSEDGSLSLSLSWNLFNGFRDRISWQNARIEAKNRQLALDNTRNELRGLLQEKYQTFRKQLELVALEQENVQAARQNLQLQQERLELGAATSLEFRDAQLNLIQAQSGLITARFQARVTRLELDQLTGRLTID